MKGLHPMTQICVVILMAGLAVVFTVFFFAL